MAHGFRGQIHCPGTAKPVFLNREMDWIMTAPQRPLSDADRKALMDMLGDDPDSDAIDCRTRSLQGPFSDNFRFTIADLARFIMELKQSDVA